MNEQPGDSLNAQGTEDPPDEQPALDPRDRQPPVDQMVQVRRRRSPKYPVFLGVGLGIGVLAAVVLTYSLPLTDEYGYGAVVGYVALTLGLLGAMVGGAVALLLDRRR